jgi:hypothetical protein
MIALMVSEYEAAMVQQIVTEYKIKCYFNLHATQILDFINQIRKKRISARIFAFTYKWVPKEEKAKIFRGLIKPIQKFIFEQQQDQSAHIHK